MTVAEYCDQILQSATSFPANEYKSDGDVAHTASLMMQLQLNCLLFDL